MRVAQSHWFAGFVMVSVTAGGCHGTQLRSYTEQLECGMTLQEIRRISEVPIEVVGEHRLGNHRASFGRNALWLGFVDGHLRTATSQTITGLTSARLSPKRDLCTGEFTYFLSVEWITDFGQPAVYLDGELIAKKAASGIVLEVGQGEHVIRLETPGIEPVEKRLVLDKGSFGDQWIDFDELPPDAAG